MGGGGGEFFEWIDSVFDSEGLCFDFVCFFGVVFHENVRT